MKVELTTTYGNITLKLDAEKAPITTDNFVQYVKDGHYDNTVFHRVISNFMVQGGGFDENMNQKPTRAPIENEASNGLSNTVGAVAMARTPDPHSASSQFFINVADNHFLDQKRSADGWGYTVFGNVVDGMDVVEKIRDVPTGSNGPHQDVPVEPVMLKTAQVKEED